MPETLLRRTDHDSLGLLIACSNGSWFLPETLVRRTDHDSLGLLIACRFDSLTSFFDSLSIRHKGLEKIAASADIPMLVCGDFNSTPGRCIIVSFSERNHE
ncbi:hypothetical protein V2J09_006648 [Rumex salicifolius]